MPILRQAAVRQASAATNGAAIENGAPVHPVELERGPRRRSSSPTAAFPLTLRGVGKRWTKKQAPVLDGVDLTLDLGTKTWVGGRNGVGKTTLLRIAAGLIDPDRGEARVWGYTARQSRARYQRLVSFLPAGDRGLYARLTVRHQLDFWARVALIPTAEVGAMVDGAIEAFDLGDLAERRVDRMSMGQRQRLRIAMTFMTKPEIVLLDEPLTSLDADGAAVLDRAIEELLGRHGALLWCSPSGEPVEQRFDSRLLLEDGRLIEG